MFDEKVQYQEHFSEEEQLIIKKEYNRLKDVCYLDHAGCPVYGDSQLSSTFDELRSNIYGNPHSGNSTSQFCSDSVDQIRYKVLQHFNTTADEYSVIFTSGATAALKLVAESFLWFNKCDYVKKDINEERPTFMYMEDNHTSVLGMRNVIESKDVEIRCLSHKDTISTFSNHRTVPLSNCGTNSLFVYSAQCNFSGVKYPLSWVQLVQTGIFTNLTNYQSNWYCLLDAASFVGTNKLDLSVIKPDFVTISFYKMFGFPTGLGALIVKSSASHLLRKRYYGGGTVLMAMSEKNIFEPRPVLHQRFEDGTINFLSIISLNHGFKTYEKVVSLDKISKHCFELARYVFHCLSRLHHANSNPLAIIYADTDYSDSQSQGNILNFNLLRPDGQYIGYAEVMNLANLHGIQLRTGCFCNPGACRRHLVLSSNEVMKHFQAGHVCGDNNDLIEGRPTGSVRISFGPYTTFQDVTKFLNFVQTCFALKPSLHKNPDSWQINDKKSLSETNPLEGRIKAMSLVYYWLENVDFILNEGNNCNLSANDNVTTEKTIVDETTLAKPTISCLFLYPVKSCASYSVKRWQLSSTGLKYDREWMITTASGVVLTQKSDHRLCLIKPSININNKKLILSFKGFPSFSLNIDDGNEERDTKEAWLCSSKVCGDAVRGTDCGDSVSLWLSLVLGKEGLRLVRQHERNTKSPDKLSFSNQAQYLLINKASVDWLSDQIEDTAVCKKETMIHRFRSNFVLEGLDRPFEEQNWTEVKLGNNKFKVCGPCSRCQMICIDQESGEKTKEPLTTLAATLKGKLRFGIYLANESTSHVTLAVGEPVSFKTEDSQL